MFATRTAVVCVFAAPCEAAGNNLRKYILLRALNADVAFFVTNTSFSYPSQP